MKKAQPKQAALFYGLSFILLPLTGRLLHRLSFHPYMPIPSRYTKGTGRFPWVLFSGSGWLSGCSPDSVNTLHENWQGMKAPR
jgi:hypothetical protein